MKLKQTRWSALLAALTCLAGLPASATTFTLDQVSTVVTPSTQGTANTTWFGWDTFCDPGFDNVPINDTTPDIGTTTTGVSFVTTNAEDHISSSRNFYNGVGTVAEEVTVATAGTPGSGFTTIIAQAVTAFGGFPAALSFGSIAGVAPTVVQTTNAAGKGQVVALWKLPGNAASYTFTVSGPPGQTAFSFDKFIVDTLWSLDGYSEDAFRATTPAIAHVMNAAPGLVAPSTRGNLKTTWFGWDTFNDVGARNVPIDDSTPDLGTTTTGTNFKTTNGEDHVLDSGNLYFFAGTLAEQITVPTNGTVGSGFTTLILQIASASGFGAFANTITLGSINGVAPEIVQSVNSTATGQLWAKWKLPGNQASYTITISGPANQPHFSFDKVTVDTLWSATAYQGDSMAASAPSLVTSSPLPVSGVGAAYSQQLSGTGGNTPFTYAVSAGTLPAGLSLSSSGLIDGSPTAAGASNFTVQLTDVNGLIATKAFDLTVTTTPAITTDSPLPIAVVGVAYTQTFAATGGTTAYEWSVSAGTLPAGLSLNSTTGALSGTPATAGTSNFTIKVQDINGFAATKAFSVTFFDLTITTASPLPGAVQGVPYNVALAATGGAAPYAWSVSSGTLPVGLTLSSAGVLSGTPTAAGLSTFTVQLTDDDGFAITQLFALTNFAGYQVPVVNPISFGALPIGATFAYTVSATNYPKSFAIVGLPQGMAFNATTGAITGKPSVTGVFNIQVTAKNTGGTSATVTAPLVVKALPTNMTGTFNGLVARHTNNQNLGSKLSLTVAANGFFTSKITTGTTLKSAAGYLAASAPQVVLQVNGLSLSLTLANNELTGTYGSAVVTGYRQVWNAALNPCEDLVGYYSIALELATPGDVGVASIPQGYGFATFTVTNAGTFTLVGKSADGQVITSPGFVGPAGELCVYAPQYANKGSLWGELTLTADAGGLFVDNTASGTLDWFKAATTVPARTYLSTFTVSLNAYGKYLAPKATGSVVLGLPSAGNLDLDFSDAGLSLAAQNPDVTFTYSSTNVVTVPTNPTKTTLTINKANGVVSGKFTLSETTPLLVRKDIVFSGQTVRFATGNVKAVGHFLLPQIPLVGQTATTAPILSGGFVIEP